MPDWSTCVDSNGVATLQCIPVVIQNLVNAALILAGVITLFILIYAGALYVTSKGDPQKLDSAKKTFTWAIIGLVIILLSFTIIAVISKLTGVEQIAKPTI